jgi:hypothetical protein
MKAVKLQSIQDETTVYFDDLSSSYTLITIDAMTAWDMSMRKIVCGKWN